MPNPTATLPRPAPWIPDATETTAEEDRLRDQIAALEASLAEKDQSIAFLRDLLTEQWFDSQLSAPEAIWPE